MTPETIRATLVEARQAIGASQRQLAAAMRRRGHEWRQTTVSMKEHGQRDIKVRELCDWFDALEDCERRAG